MWNSLGNVSEAYVPPFRYIKYRVTVAGTAASLLQINSINVKLDVKQRTITVLANVTDVTRIDSTAGDQVLFSSMNIAPVSVIGITASAPFLADSSKDPVKALINFTSAPYPTYFRVLAWDKTGARCTCSNVVVTIRYI